MSQKVKQMQNQVLWSFSPSIFLHFCNLSLNFLPLTISVCLCYSLSLCLSILFSVFLPSSLSLSLSHTHTLSFFHSISISLYLHLTYSHFGFSSYSLKQGHLKIKGSWQTDRLGWTRISFIPHLYPEQNWQHENVLIRAGMSHLISWSECLLFWKEEKKTFLNVHF